MACGPCGRSLRHHLRLCVKLLQIPNPLRLCVFASEPVDPYQACLARLSYATITSAQ